MKDVFKGFACVSSSIISSPYVSTFSELTNIFSLSIFQLNICSYMLPRVQYLHQQSLHGSLQRRHLTPSVKLWTTEPNATVHLDSSQTPPLLLAVSSNLRHARPMLSAPSAKSVMESSVRMFALMTRTVLLTRCVTMVSASLSVAEMMIVTVKRFVRV